MISLPEILKDAYIFPCVPNGKEPASKNGWKIASNDPAQIAEWEQINPDFNWALATGLSGLFVIDVDPNGLDWWAKLLERDPAIREAVERAYQVRTPRGGLHVYFRGEGPSTASRIADGIDTRGGINRNGKIVSGGYVLLPGSKTGDGSYASLPGGAINTLPPAVVGIVPERQRTDTLGLTKAPDKDLPRNIQTANDLIANYVKSGRVAIEGKGGDNLTFAVCASILDKGISPGVAFDLLWEKWNPHCQPPWDEWELELKVINAAKHGEDTESGAKGFQSNADAFAAFAGMETPTALTEAKPERSARNRLMWLHDYADGVQDPEWLIPGLVPSSGTGMIYGQSGSYKSFVALDMSLCLGFGIPGQWGAPPVKNDVVYFAGEGSIATAKKRWPAWMDYHKIEFRNDHRFMIFDRVPLYSDVEEWENIKADLHAMKAKPALMVIDTLARFGAGLDENSATDATRMTNFGEQLARYYECFVLFVHHEGKDASRGARGSSAFYANMDMALNTKKVREGTELRVKKQKDADVPDDVTFLKVTPSGNSIVLLKSDEKPTQEGDAKGSSYGWAQAKEVVAVLNSMGGEASHSVLSASIAGPLGIDSALVSRILAKSDDLGFLRPTKGHWKIPSEREFDL